MTTSPAPSQWIPEWGFGDRVRKVRTELGMDQKEFAQKLDIKAPSLAAYETGRANPRSRDLPSLAARLELLTGVPRTWFLGWEEENPRPGNDPDGGNDGAAFETRTRPYALQGDRNAEVIPLFAA